MRYPAIQGLLRLFQPVLEPRALALPTGFAPPDKVFSSQISQFVERAKAYRSLPGG